MRQSQVRICFGVVGLAKGERLTDHQKEKSVLLQKNFQDRLNRERLREKLEFASLKEVPLEVRRKEAKKPLFLTRYE